MMRKGFISLVMMAILICGIFISQSVLAATVTWTTTGQYPIKDQNGNDLALHSLVQLILIGDNNQIDLPKPDGSTTGDDVVLSTYSIGEPSFDPGFDLGRFTKNLPYSDTLIAKKVYTRVFNAADPSQATHYGNSILYTLTGVPGERFYVTTSTVSLATDQPMPVAAPVVASVNPSSGLSNQVVAITISGSSFKAGATVLIGTTAATDVHVADASTIHANVPSDITPGSYAVKVTNPDDQVSNVNIMYAVNAPLTITAVTPAFGARFAVVGVTITGTGFVSGTTVKVGGNPALQLTISSSTSISASFPPMDLGSYTVTLENPDGQIISRENAYVISAAPTIASVTPSTGRSDQPTNITVTGTGFLEGASVRIGNLAATDVSRVNATTLTATVPTGLRVGGYDVVVTNPDAQSASLAAAFTVAYPAGFIQVTMPAQLSGVGGVTINVPISINESSGIMAWDMILTFDPQALTFLEVTRGPLTQDYNSVLGNESQSGQLLIGGLTLVPTSGGGILINVSFVVNNQAVGSSNLNLSFKDDPGNDLRSVTPSSSTFTTQPRVLTVGSATKRPGEQVTIPISINESAGIDAFNMTLHYDSQALTFSSVDITGTLTADYILFQYNGTVAGQVIMGGSTLSPTTGGGVMVNVLFTVKPTAVGTSALTLTVLDDPGNDLRGSTINPGTLTVLDTVAPTVTAFVIPAASRTLAVAITTFEATDNVAVTGYLITETSEKPAADAPGWTTAKPTSYTFTTEGVKTLYAWAKDAAKDADGNAASNVSDSRSATVNVDITAPTVTAFVIPATSTELTVPITTFTATDNVAVTGYLVTESAAPPAADAPGWTTAKPPSYTFATPGPKTLYAWARDAAGNVSDSRSATVDILTLLVTGIEPAFGFNDKETSVTIFGFNFAQGATAKIGTTALAVTFVSATQLTGKVPSGLAPGVYGITVTKDTESHTLPQAFTVYAPVIITPIPTTITLVSGGAPFTFLSTGGSGNFLFEKVSGPAGGFIDPQTGKFTADLQNSAGKYTIKVTDPISQAFKTLNFVVRIRVESKSVLQGLETTLLASGGTSPYTCVSDNPAVAEVVQSTVNGCLMKGVKQGAANITVTDSNPQFSLDERKEYSGVGRIIVYKGGTITGTVVDIIGNAGIPQANISILETGAVYVSAQNGSFAITLPLGKYTLSFSKADYESVIIKVTLDKDTLNLGLVTLAGAVEILGGTVVDLADVIVPGAEIFAVALEQGKPKVFASSITDSLGKFTLYLKTAGPYDLIAKKAGYGDSIPKIFNTGVTNAVVRMEVIVNSSEITEGDQRITTIQIYDNGALGAAPTVSLRDVDPDGKGPLLARKGKGTLSTVARPPMGNNTLWELKYTPKTDVSEPDADGHLIGVLVEPLGAGVPTGAVKYSFTIHPNPAVKAPSKKVSTVINLGIVIVGKPVGAVTKEGQIVDADDATNFVLDPDNLTTPPGETRALNLTRFELADSTAEQAINNLKNQDPTVTAMSEVYDFAYVNPDTGEERGNEVRQITVKIKVNLATFDPDNWKPMISHDLTDPASWQFTEVVPGSAFFDGQYLSFDLTTLFGQGVVVVSPPALVAPPVGGEAADGICFITTAFGTIQEDVMAKDGTLVAATRIALYPVIGIGKLMTVTTMGQKLAILLVFMGGIVGVVSIMARGKRREFKAEYYLDTTEKETR